MKFWTYILFKYIFDKLPNWSKLWIETKSLTDWILNWWNFIYLDYGCMVCLRVIFFGNIKLRKEAWVLFCSAWVGVWCLCGGGEDFVLKINNGTNKHVGSVVEISILDDLTNWIQIECKKPKNKTYKQFSFKMNQAN